MPALRKFLILLLLLPHLAYGAFPCCCRRLQLPGWWGTGEYLLTWRKERFYPPLVTTSPPGTPLNEAGILGLPTTTILFGDEHKGDSPQSGVRFDGGFWLTHCLGFGASWTAFGKEDVDFHIQGNAMGNPIFGIPFNSSGVPSFFPVSHPEAFGDGKLNIHATNNIWAADLYTRLRGLDMQFLHLDFLAGFRYTRLTDSITINASADIPLAIDAPFTTFDSFDAENNFYSGLLGVVGEITCGRWWLYFDGKFGLGNMVKSVQIEGESTVFIPLIGPIVFPESVFAWPSNKGNHSDNSFEIVSEANAKVGYFVWRNMMITAGYQFIYWPNVFLSADQIDPNIDETQATPNPRFPGRNSNFWAHGLTVGFYFLY